MLHRCTSRIASSIAHMLLGVAMRSCAVWLSRWRRCALHAHGHRAVRHRGDSRHRSRGACGSGRVRSGERVSADGVRRPIAMGVAAPAVRSTTAAAAAWFAWAMAPSRSRAARSRTPGRCVRARRMLHVPRRRLRMLMLCAASCACHAEGMHRGEGVTAYPSRCAVGMSYMLYVARSGTPIGGAVQACCGACCSLCCVCVSVPFASS